MADRPVLPYGSWPSPISIAMSVAGAIALREPRLAGDDVYWTEGRPAERGRQVIVRWSERDGARDVTPPGFNARTMAHEYGGGAYAVDRGTVYFVNLDDGRIYRQPDDVAPEPLTAEGPYRYGDLVIDAGHARLLCVREDMSAEPEPADELVAIDPRSGTVTVLARGHDFYSTPRPTADGGRLAWLAWRHPNMPWDGTELWLAAVEDDGSLRDPRMIAGGADESIVQPEWAPDGTLVFASDRSGWWNLYRLAPGDGSARPLAPAEAEFAGPQWVFGMSWYGIAPDGTIVASALRDGRATLWLIPADGRSPEPLALPDAQIDSVVVGGSGVVYLGSGPTEARAVVLIDLTGLERRVLRRSAEIAVPAGFLARPEAISFPTTDGDTAHALYYPPTNPDVAGPPDERPPLVVMTHGGPTSAAGGSLDLGKQVFTSRGFAVVDVDYRGSSGHGREYMRRLDGKWGIYDVDDAVAAARYLAERGDVDAARMAIRGGSAGGYTTLSALAFRDVFAAGASHYGVGDLEALTRDTHKFESRYLDRLVAPYPAGVEVYRERSPIHFCERINCPLIVLQGLDDKVVPREQAERLVAALRERRIPHAYLPFEGEGHGFRQAANMTRALEAELSFYAQVFGFRLADGIDPVEVQFLPTPRE